MQKCAKVCKNVEGAMCCHRVSRQSITLLPPAAHPLLQGNIITPIVIIIITSNIIVIIIITVSTLVIITINILAVVTNAAFVNCPTRLFFNSHLHFSA